MPPISALLHTANDALRLGRTLETLYPCDEILVVDHDSSDSTTRLAREYGARVISAEEAKTTADYLQLSAHEWIFCLEPREALTEALAASLFEWRRLPSKSTLANAFAVALREEASTISSASSGWLEPSEPQTRLVPRSWTHWENHLPVHDSHVPLLLGELLRFAFP
jgi:glycosyltransferase involved in cell wall biosynthesis